MKRLLALIGILILVIILINLDIGRIAGILLGINLGFFALGVLLDLSSAVIKAKKWQILVNAEERLLNFKKSLEYSLMGFFLSVLTPGRIGDLARAFYLKRETKSLGKALSTVVLDRLIDVVMLFALGFVAIVSFTSMFGQTIVPIWILAVCSLALVAAALFVLKRNFVGFFLKPFFKAFVPQKLKQSLRLTFDEFYGFFARVRRRPFILVLPSALGLFTWIMAFASSYLFALALGIPLSFQFVALVVPIILLLDLLPISFSGIGTRDAALIFLFGLQGIAAEEAVAFSFVFLLSGYWIVALVGSVLFMRNSISLDFFEKG